MILEAKTKHLNKIVLLHRQVLGNTSSSKFGFEFVRNLYKTLIDSDQNSKTWIIYSNNKVLGFVSVSSKIKKTTRNAKSMTSLDLYLHALITLIKDPMELFNFIDRIIFDHHIMNKYGDYPSILTIGVSPKLQGKGYGRKMINLITRYFKEQGFNSYFVDTASSNINARKFYRSCGFKEIYESNRNVLLKINI